MGSSFYLFSVMLPNNWLRQSLKVKQYFKTGIIYFQEPESDASSKSVFAQTLILANVHRSS